jgi:hypothetical protein
MAWAHQRKVNVSVVKWKDVVEVSNIVRATSVLGLEVLIGKNKRFTKVATAT